MSESVNNTELNTTQTTVKSGYEDDGTKIPDPTNTDDKSKKEDNLDEFGYEKTPADPAKSDTEEDKKPEPTKEEDDDLKKATGYDDDDSEDDKSKDKTDDKKDEDKDKETSEEDLKKEIDTALEKLPEGFSKEKISQFATDNKMTKDQMEAYVEFVKSENDESIKTSAENTKIQRKAWSDELKDDSEFGGENFKKNVHSVEKILENHMPNMKKVLTDRGNMLPPYIMKDLLKLSKVLNPKTNLVTGDPKAPEKKEDTFLDTMYV